MRLLADLRRLGRYRELMGTLLVRDLKVRYRQTALGLAWAILQPVSMAVVLSAVFSPFVASPAADERGYFLFVYAGVLAWNLMAAALSFGSTSLIGHASLLTKVAFPREVFPLSATLVNLFDYAAGLSILLLALLWRQHALPWTALLLPGVVIVELLLASALAMLLSAINVFFRDVRFLLPLLTLIWMFLTPVFYPSTRLSPTVAGIVAWNPMAGVVEMHRMLLLEGRLPAAGGCAALALGCGALFLASYLLFKRWEPLFAEVV